MFYEHMGPVPIRIFKVHLSIPSADSTMAFELLYEVRAFDFIGAVAEAQQQFTRTYDERLLRDAFWKVSTGE